MNEGKGQSDRTDAGSQTLYEIIRHPSGKGWTFRNLRNPRWTELHVPRPSALDVMLYLRNYCGVGPTQIVWRWNWMSDKPRLIVANAEHTRSLGIAGMRAAIEDKIDGDYWCVVYDLDGLPAGPYRLTVNDLEVEAPCPKTA